MADYHDTWHAVAISPDGTKLAVGGGTDDERCPLCQSIPPPVNSIYVSTNGGATWTGGPIDAWQAIAASADWTKLVAVSWQLIFSPFGFVTPSGKIYTSTNSGVTWTANTNFAPNVWSSVASSADGTRLVAAAGFSLGSWLLGDGSIYVTTDSGSTWVRTGAPTNDWTSVASSADGTKLVAAADTNPFGDGLLYLSHDAGATWAPANLPTNNWASVASSVDGTLLVAAGWGQEGGVIYRSADSGASWTLTGAPSDQYWSSVASSADGTTLLAGGNFMYMSRDSGSTWTLTGAPLDYPWSTVALSADGSRAVAGGWSNLCTLPYSGTWRMADLPANSWFSIASSADGSRVVAAAGYPSLNQVYQSTNWGATWTVSSTNFSGPLASSADGTKLFAAAGLIYASSDSGATWSPIRATNLNSTSIASSGDGSVLIAASYGLYISTNGGASWSRPSSAGLTNNQFAGLASSADGAKLVAVAAGPVYGGDGYIYTSSDSGKDLELGRRPAKRLDLRRLFRRWREVGGRILCVHRYHHGRRIPLHFHQFGSDLEAHPRAEERLEFRRLFGGRHTTRRGHSDWRRHLPLERFREHLGVGQRPSRQLDGHHLLGRRRRDCRGRQQRLNLHLTHPGSDPAGAFHRSVERGPRSFMDYPVNPFHAATKLGPPFDKLDRPAGNPDTELHQSGLSVGASPSAGCHFLSAQTTVIDSRSNSPIPKQQQQKRKDKV
jgi:hypothetical protein